MPYDPWEDFAEAAAPYTRHVPLDHFDYTVNVSLQYRYLYVENPKCGTSSIKAALFRMEMRDPKYEWKYFPYLHMRQYAPLLRPSQVGNLDRFLARDDITKFCFCRNPYSRVLSAYLDKIVRNQPPKQELLKHMGLPPDAMGRHVSFADFLHAISTQSIVQMNSHWRPQYYQTFQDCLTYDFIGRFESFDADLTSVGTRLSADFPQYIRPVLDRRTDAANQFRQYYTEPLVELVSRLYADDFRHFGYATEFSYDI